MNQRFQSNFNRTSSDSTRKYKNYFIFKNKKKYFFNFSNTFLFFKFLFIYLFIFLIFVLFFCTHTHVNDKWFVQDFLSVVVI